MMKVASTMVTLAVGAAFGVAFVLSCSDDAPHHADAATCDCPASEPPLAGRFVTVMGDPVTIAAGSVSGAGAQCPQNSQLISGTCTGTNPGLVPTDLVLTQSGFFMIPNPPTGPAWSCTFKNTGASPIMVQSIAICLKLPT